MDSDASAHDLLERMLLDTNVEPTYMPLSLLKSITNNFSNDQEIGVGGFAVVYKGQLRNGTIAVKKLTQTLDVHETKFHQEVDSLMRVKHKNIVRFLGYCSDTQGKVWKLAGKNVMAEERQRVLCFEFFPQGSLNKYISDASQGFQWITRYHIIKGICEGLHYLHQQNIVHLDLKPANILLDKYMVPKITDFGLSKCFDEKQTRAMTSKVFGTEGYMAPELYSGQITFKSDIYSLGIIIIEILTGQKGYPEIENVLQSWTARFGTSQGDISLEPVRICTEIGIECTDFNPRKRPAAELIIERLAEMERTFGFIITSENHLIRVGQESNSTVDCDASSAEEDQDNGTSDGESGSMDRDKAEDGDNNIALASKLCTFTLTGREYMKQRWYFCYTCDLTVHKGCCSVCVKVCHQGHRVMYARSSRFFCDCGAGSMYGSSCQCLRPQNLTGMSTDLFTSSVPNVDQTGSDKVEKVDNPPSESTGSDDMKPEAMTRIKSVWPRYNRFPVLVRVMVPLRCSEDSLRVGLDLVAVLDIDTTMDPVSLKNAMLFIIDNLGPDDRLSVVSSNHQEMMPPRRVTELILMSDVNRKVTRRLVQELVTEQLGYMSLGVEAAVKILRERGRKERSNRVGRIIILSTSGDSSILDHHMTSEFPVETFGLDCNDPTVLYDIADRTLSVYSYVNQDLDKITGACAQSLGGLMSVNAMDVQVNLQTVDGVAMSYINSGNYPTVMSSDKRSATIQIPDLYTGEQKNFMVYLTIPEGEQQDQFLTVSGSYRNPKIGEAIQLDASDLVVLWSKGATNSSDKPVCPDLAAELIRLRLVESVWTMAEQPSSGRLQRLWEDIKGSEDGRNAPESAVLVLDKDVAEMQHEGLPFMLSWLISHGLQRATTKGSPTKSSAFRVKAMEEMIKKVDAKVPKR